MSAKVNKKPWFTARMYDMRRGKRPWQRVGVEALDITVYLPEDRSYDTMKPRIVPGREAAFKFTGAEINLDDKNLYGLCRRLAEARRSLVAYILRLAARA
jgi:hypothetical protein